MDLRNKTPLLNLESPWANNDNPIWLASTVRMYRNVEKFNFPPKMNPDKRKQIITLVSNKILGLKELVDPVFLKGEDTTPLRKAVPLRTFFNTSLLSTSS